MSSSLMDEGKAGSLIAPYVELSWPNDQIKIFLSLTLFKRLSGSLDFLRVAQSGLQ